MKFESSGYEIATTADKVCAAPFKHGDRVRHLQRDQVGIIFFGPDSDLDYKVRWEDSSGDSGYVNASGLRAELHGFLWVCTDGTEAECLEKGLFGGATNLKTKNRAGDFIARGTPCFLYNITSKKLRGPYAALTGIGEYDQLAWGGKFPCQVRDRKGRTHTASATELPKGAKFGIPSTRQDTRGSRHLCRVPLCRRPLVPAPMACRPRPSLEHS